SGRHRRSGPVDSTIDSLGGYLQRDRLATAGIFWRIVPDHRSGGAGWYRATTPGDGGTAEFAQYMDLRRGGGAAFKPGKQCSRCNVAQGPGASISRCDPFLVAA